MKRTVALCAIMLVNATAAFAQADTVGYATPAPKWVGQFTTVSANAIMGGVSAGIIQELRGGSFKDGFTRGALGGVVVYAAKRVAAERWYGAGLLGREIGGVGASIVRNASDGIGSFDRLVLPAGIARVYWNRTRAERGSVRVKLDVVAAGYVAYGLIEDELHFDVRESFSGGTPVFRTANKVIAFGSGDDDHAAGITGAGVVFRSAVPGWGREFLERALAHERVHVVQDDQLFITLNDHLDDWVFSKLGPVKPVARFIDLNASTEVLKLIAQFIPGHADRPWELEAIFLTK